ncbi:MAG: rod shape-determining protein MreC [Pyrinomonadaceae bacterium]|nr:rod shape-determining protein MreC [Pyrinomonadaceae bacterium]
MVERSQKEIWRISPWLAISLLIANFILMAWDARTESNQRILRVWIQSFASFVQSPVAFIVTRVNDYVDSYLRLRSAASENELLKQRLHELEMRLQENELLVSENERLKKLLELKEGRKYQIRMANVIARDPLKWFGTLIIDRGSSDGVKVNMPVITSGGVVGRVTTVTLLTSQVMLLTDEKSGAGALIVELGKTGALGVIKGTGKRDLLEMRYVSGSVEVNIGDSVYTSGQDGIYPHGLKIGEVVDIVKGSTTTPHLIFVKPTADLSSIKEVAVLLYEPPKLDEEILQGAEGKGGRK